jgi:hypothetical protein
MRCLGAVIAGTVKVFVSYREDCKSFCVLVIQDGGRLVVKKKTLYLFNSVWN